MGLGLCWVRPRQVSLELIPNPAKVIFGALPPVAPGMCLQQHPNPDLSCLSTDPRGDRQTDTWRGPLAGGAGRAGGRRSAGPARRARRVASHGGAGRVAGAALQPVCHRNGSPRVTDGGVGAGGGGFHPSMLSLLVAPKCPATSHSNTLHGRSYSMFFRVFRHAAHP